MKNFIHLRTICMLLMTFLSLCACASPLDLAYHTVLINDTEYTIDYKDYQKIECKKNTDNEIVICIPEGALGYSWVPFSYSDHVKLVKEEQLLRKIPNDTDGESKHAQKFTFHIQKEAPVKITLKQLFIDDKEKQMNDSSIHWYSELEIVLP